MKPNIAKESFWAELAPCDHLLQLYDNDDVFLDALSGFVGGGLQAGEGVIVIATASHLAGLHHRLQRQGVSWLGAKVEHRYFPLEVHRVLAEFMVRGLPDRELFEKTVKTLLAKARGNGRKVRAFGEMVAIMLSRGEAEATVELERLWQGLCEAEKFPLFCAYPKTQMTKQIAVAVSEICAAHSRLISVQSNQDSQLTYHSVPADPTKILGAERGIA